MLFQILFLLSLYDQPDLKTILPAKVVSVQDGDTITVEFSFRANIRLKDCWAPETRTKDEAEKKKGLESKEFLKGLLKPGDDVIIEVPYSPNMSHSWDMFIRIWMVTTNPKIFLRKWLKLEWQRKTNNV